MGRGSGERRSTRTPSLDNVFDQLVRSAFDFLERAIEQVETDRKHSIINFATAIELFLKARLFKEHWSLVADTAEAPDRAGFLNGNVKTVTPDKAMQRLDKTCGDPVPIKAAQEFKRLASHRNKAMHFFHEASSPDASKEALEQTVMEQFRGWHHLEELLGSWSKHLGDYTVDIRRVTWKMRRHVSFLTARFEEMKEHLEQEMANGAVFARCESCGHDSAAVEYLTNIVSHLNCRVCGVINTRISFDCLDDDCGHPVVLSSHIPGHRSCIYCKKFHDNVDIREVLGGGASYEDMAPNINCAACTTLGSGVEHEDVVVCSECLIAEKNLHYCGWCSEGQMGAGDLRNSEWVGCEFCEGRAGWESD